MLGVQNVATVKNVTTVENVPTVQNVIAAAVIPSVIIFSFTLVTGITVGILVLVKCHIIRKEHRKSPCPSHSNLVTF